MRYGLPYKGSKNSIAGWIVNTLPEFDIMQKGLIT
jgi:site-specific DNA-adenine methylase